MPEYILRKVFYMYNFLFVTLCLKIFYFKYKKSENRLHFSCVFFISIEKWCSKSNYNGRCVGQFYPGLQQCKGKGPAQYLV